MRFADAPTAVAKQTALDKPAGVYRDVIRKVVPPGHLRDALHGVWLGHPLHPALVQLPVGAFITTVILDWLPGEHHDADAVLATGVVASVPAIVTGAADFSEGHEEQQRVGLVHAAANTVALGLYLVSLRQRRCGDRAAGKVSAVLGLGISGLAAALGGHMSFSMAMGANHAQGVPHIAPASETDLGSLDEFGDRQPVRRMAGTVPVLVVREGDAVHVLADDCAHADGPLHEGTLTDAAGQLCVQCPWHGSVFRLADGVVQHGPATADQPVFDTRVADGRVLAKVREVAGVPAAG